MELDSFDTITLSNKGVEFALKDLRTNKDTDAFITVIGRDSDEYRAIRTERTRMLADRASAGQSDEFTQAELDTLACELLGRCTKGWRGITQKGEAIVFSEKAAMDLYAKYPAIREQVNVFIGERANFILA
jgi:hypothetical protein